MADALIGPRLAETGQILVTLAAARSAGLTWACGDEEARRRLTVLLCDAHAVDAQVQPERWRAKRRSSGWDISATISREPPLVVVVSASVRPLSGGDPRRELEREAAEAGVTVERAEGGGWQVRHRGELLEVATTRARVRELMRRVLDR